MFQWLGQHLKHIWKKITGWLGQLLPKRNPADTLLNRVGDLQQYSIQQLALAGWYSPHISDEAWLVLLTKKINQLPGVAKKSCRIDQVDNLIQHIQTQLTKGLMPPETHQALQDAYDWLTFFKSHHSSAALFNQAEINVFCNGMSGSYRVSEITENTLSLSKLPGFFRLVPTSEELLKISNQCLLMRQEGHEDLFWENQRKDIVIGDATPLASFPCLLEENLGKEGIDFTVTLRKPEQVSSFLDHYYTRIAPRWLLAIYSSVWSGYFFSTPNGAGPFYHLLVDDRGEGVTAGPAFWQSHRPGHFEGWSSYPLGKGGSRGLHTHSFCSFTRLSLLEKAAIRQHFLTEENRMFSDEEILFCLAKLHHLILKKLYQPAPHYLSNELDVDLWIKLQPSAKGLSPAASTMPDEGEISPQPILLQASHLATKPRGSESKKTANHWWQRLFAPNPIQETENNRKVIKPQLLCQ